MGNYLLPKDDGLPVCPSGIWVRDKLLYLGKYVPALEISTKIRFVKKTIPYFIRLFLILSLPLLIISCSIQTYKSINPEENPELVDQSWLTDKPCSAPCWQGIRPGISSRQDAVQAVRGLSFVDGENMRTYNKSSVSFLCRVPSNITCVFMEFKDGILIDVQLYINYQLSIKNVVGKLGAPDGYTIIRPRPETKGCDTEFLWINRQLSVEYYEEPHNFGNDLCDLTYANNGKIPEELDIQNVNYMESGAMEKIIQIAQKPGTGYKYIPWKGFVN